MKFLWLKVNFVLAFFLLLFLFLNYSPLLIFFDLLATLPVIWSAYLSLKNKKISIDLLAAIALFVSIVHQEWSSVAFINLMITSARIFEIYIENRAKKALESLIKLRPEKVKIKLKNKIVEVPLSKVKVNDVVLIETGDIVAVDGLVLSGFASLNQASLTGESLPVAKKAGDSVYCSTVNLSGTLLVKALKVGSETSFEKMIDLVEKAEQDKSGVNSLVDKFATVYIASTLILSLLIFLFTSDIKLILSFLLVTCADDIAVAVPLAYWGAIAKAAKNGVIIKKSLSLEILKNIKTLVVDKTGTLTKGEIKVQHCLSFIKNENEMIKLAAEVACVSSHPVAKAILFFAESKHISISPMKNFIEIPGKGLEAKDSKHIYRLGSLNFLKSRQIIFNREVLQDLEKIESEAHNLLVFSKDEKIIGLFGLGDELRYQIKKIISDLRKQGLSKIIMLTGDNSIVAKNIAQELSLDEYQANLLPQEKLFYLENKIKRSSPLAYIGDGVNDAASLARADVGIAMGGIGSDAAIEAADITLMNDNLEKVVYIMKLSRKLGNIVIQNFIIWGLVNLIGLILVFIFKISPQIAASYNFITDFIPMLNSLRIFKN